MRDHKVNGRVDIMDEIYQFGKVVDRVFREEMKVTPSYSTHNVYRYYVHLPAIYDSILDLGFSKERWNDAIKDVDEFSSKIGRVKKWIVDDFEWGCKEQPPIAFKVALNFSRIKRRLYRMVENYLGIEYRERRGKGFYVLVFDVDVYRLLYSSQRFFSRWFAYESLLLEYFKTTKPELSRKRAFVHQIGSVDKGKKVFVELIDATTDLLLSAKKRYEQFIEFLSQPIADFSQMTKPGVVENGIEREKVFKTWTQSLEEAFYYLFCSFGIEEYAKSKALLLPGNGDPERENRVVKMIDCIEKLKKLVNAAGSEVAFRLRGNYLEAKTPYLLEVGVPRFYAFRGEGRKRELPFVNSLSPVGGKREDFVRYLDGLEGFLRGILLKFQMERRHKKGKKLML